MTDAPLPLFDEDAALRNLEGLRREIEATREHRERTLAAFEDFVRSSRAISLAERSAALAAAEAELAASRVHRAAQSADRARRPDAGPRSDAAPPDDAAHRQDAAFRPDRAPQAAARSEAVPAGRPAAAPALPAPALPPPKVHLDADYMIDTSRDPFGDARPVLRWDRRTAAIVAGVVLLLLALVFGQWTSGSSGDAGSSDGQSAPASADARAQSGRSNGATQPAAARPVQIELTTVRPVWMRVTVDGENQYERVAPAGQTLTFGGDRTIAVRTGDAGAVRVAVRGEDRGLMGGDGQIATRVFGR